MVACMYPNRRSTSSTSSARNRPKRTQQFVSKVRKTTNTFCKKAKACMTREPVGSTFKLSHEFAKRLSSSASIASKRSHLSVNGQRSSMMSTSSQPSICVTQPTQKGENIRYSIHVGANTTPYNSGLDAVEKQVRISHPAVSKVISPPAPPTPSTSSIASDDSQTSLSTVTPEDLLSGAAHITHADGAPVSAELLEQIMEALRYHGLGIKLEARPQVNKETYAALEGESRSSDSLVEPKKWEPARPSTPRFSSIDMELPAITKSASFSSDLSETSDYFSSSNIPSPVEEPSSPASTVAGASSSDEDENNDPLAGCVSPSNGTAAPAVYVPYSGSFDPYRTSSNNHDPNKGKAPADPKIRNAAEIVEAAENLRRSAYISRMDNAIFSPTLPSSSNPLSSQTKPAYERRPYTTVSPSTSAGASQQWPERSDSLPKAAPRQAIARKPVASNSSPEARKPVVSIGFLAPLPAPKPGSEPTQMSTPPPTPTSKKFYSPESVQRVRRSRLEAPCPPAPPVGSPLRRSVVSLEPLAVEVAVEEGEVVREEGAGRRGRREARKMRWEDRMSRWFD